MKAIEIGKEEAKLSLFADDLMTYIKNPKDSTKKLVDLINDPNKDFFKIQNIQKSVFFYIPIMNNQKKLIK